MRKTVTFLLKNTYNKLAGRHRAITVGLLLLLVSVFSCKAPKSTQNTTVSSNAEKSDIVRTEVRDSLITVPLDTVELRIPLNSIPMEAAVDTNKTIFTPTISEKRGRNTTSVAVKDGVLVVKTTCDSISILVTKVKELEHRLQTASKDSIVIQKEVVTVPRELSKFDWILRIFFFSALVYVTFKVYLRIKGV